MYIRPPMFIHARHGDWRDHLGATVPYWSWLVFVSVSKASTPSTMEPSRSFSRSHSPPASLGAVLRPHTTSWVPKPITSFTLTHITHAQQCHCVPLHPIRWTIILPFTAERLRQTTRPKAARTNTLQGHHHHPVHITIVLQPPPHPSGPDRQHSHTIYLFHLPPYSTKFPRLLERPDRHRSQPPHSMLHTGRIQI